MINKADLKWLACAIDSEGSIGLRKVARGKRYVYAPCVQITNTNKNYVEECRRIIRNIGYEVNTVFSKLPTKRKIWKICYTISLNRTDNIVVFLEKIKNYLIIKKKHCIVLRQYCLHRLKNQISRRNFIYTGKEEIYWKKLRKLNGRGIRNGAEVTE